VLRTPIHLSYVLCLGGFSPATPDALLAVAGRNGIPERQAG
jgi:hypothetical protein